MAPGGASLRRQALSEDSLQDMDLSDLLALLEDIDPQGHDQVKRVLSDLSDELGKDHAVYIMKIAEDAKIETEITGLQ
jgi:hypothetical protein